MNSNEAHLTENGVYLRERVSMQPSRQLQHRRRNVIYGGEKKTTNKNKNQKGKCVLSTWALTSSTRGRTAERGNRATVFLIMASFLDWKIFWEQTFKKKK